MNQMRVPLPESGDETRLAGGVVLTDVTVKLHENTVPLFVQDELESLYESPYATLAQFQSKRDALADVHTYVAYRAGKPCAVLLFRIHGGTARVLNEVMMIGAADIERFAGHVFANFRSVSVIAFHAIRSDIAPRMLRRHRFEVSEDIVLPLPASEEEYLAALGKSTRRTVKYYSNKLRREVPGFTHKVFTGNEITAAHVRAIVEMKIAQMEEKHRPSIVSEEDVERILRVTRSYGVVGIATVDGKICGGWIGYRVGGNDFMDMCVYDAAYEEYRLGTLLSYFAIVDCIARGGKECHFQWGRDDYKFRFLGVQHNLVDLVIYRSPFSMLVHAGRYWKSAARHVKRKLEERRRRTEPS